MEQNGWLKQAFEGLTEKVDGVQEDVTELKVKTGVYQDAEERITELVLREHAEYDKFKEDILKRVHLLEKQSAFNNGAVKAICVIGSLIVGAAIIAQAIGAFK